MGLLRLTGNSGTVTVEFALLMPAIFLVLVALVDVASAARVQLELVQAARAGAREAAATPDPARAVEAASDTLPDELRQAARISVSRPTRVGALAEVTVTREHRLLAPIFGGVAVQLSGRAAMAVER